MMSNTNKNLVDLNELPEYKVSDSFSDVRGWNVKDANNRVIGTVDHLLVNKVAKRVVYLDVEVDETVVEEGYETYTKGANEGVHGFLNRKGDDHLIIPIGMATIDVKNKSVKTNQIDRSTFAKAKRFKKGDPIEFGYELNIVRHYKGDKTFHNTDIVDGFYDREEFNNFITDSVSRYGL